MHQSLYALLLGLTVFCATNLDAWGVCVVVLLSDRPPAGDS